MDLKQLRTFVEVAEVGSLSKASARLRIAQPALSRQIRLLEEDLRTDLFRRHGRGMMLSEAGDVFLARARTILRQVEDARSDVADLGTAVRGSVSLGVPPTIGDVLAGRLVERFRARYPDVTLRVIPAFSGYLMDFLQRGEIDLAVTYATEHKLNVALTPLLVEALYLVGGPSAGLSLARPVRFADLGSLGLILPGERHGLRALISLEARRAGITLNVPVEADALQTLKDLVGRGLGNTILPLPPVRAELAAGQLTAAPIKGPVLSRKLMLAQPADRPDTNAVRLFAAMLREEVADLGLQSGKPYAFSARRSGA